MNKNKQNFRPTIRFKIQQLRKKKDSQFLTTEAFCHVLNLDYNRYKRYVRFERWRKLTATEKKLVRRQSRD